jgi:hypothetical protein
MKPLLNLTVSGTALTFNSDGSVTNSLGANQGSWSSQSAAPNSLTYAPTGAAAVPIAVKYGINANNQLTVAVPAAAGLAAAAAVPIEGFLVVEDNRDVVYYAIEDDDPNQPSFAFHLSGAIAIDPDKNTLTIDTAGLSGVLAIQGMALGGNTALSVGMADNAMDQIEFSAITHNPLSDGSGLDIPAQILLAGRWDVAANQIVFATSYDTTGATPQFSIRIAGNIKGVAAGFEFYSNGASPRLLFTIAGRIDSVDQSGNWSLAIGYAANILTASASLQDTIVTPGGSLSLAGTFTLTKPGAGGLTIAAQIAATWKLANGQLNVVVSGTNGTYAIKLTGDLKIDNWNVAFVIAGGSGDKPSLTINAGYAPPGSSTHAQLSLYCTANQVQLQASLSFTLNFVNGSLLPAPKPA